MAADHDHDWAGLRPPPPSPFSGLALQRLGEAAQKQGVADQLAALMSRPDHKALIGGALGDCPFLLDCAEKSVGDLVAILETPPADWCRAQCEAVAAVGLLPPAEAMAALRQAKRRVALAVGLADLAGIADLDMVTGALTDFADKTLQAALDVALAEAHSRGTWQGETGAEPGLVLLAMGKHGARELNYSSDIDIIALYDPAAGGLAADVEPSVFWVRIVRRIVALLQERTADGYVFRVDLRLRPDPGSTPVAISIPAALQYYESVGQNWERAALIKARPAAGDTECGTRFLREIVPFIWRKHLDFAAIADIHSIKRQIHAHRGHGKVRVAGHDIKRGRGGIREVELFVQTQQLIAGGRDPTLRGRRTRDMLAALAERNWIEEKVRDELDRAYCRFRMVEHRLQMVRDEQTHTLPDGAEDLARIARLCGYADPAAFADALRADLERVSRRYSRLFEHEEALSTEVGNLVFTGDDDDPDTLRTLAELGFADPAGVTRAVRAWHFGRYPATRSGRAREDLTELTPRLLRALSEGGDPDRTLRAFDTLLRSLPAGVQLFALLSSNPHLLGLLSLILGAAPRLAETFARRPHVVDALIDPALLAEPVKRGRLGAQLATSLDQATGFEDLLDRVRLFAAEHRFLISVRLIAGVLAPVAAGRAFSDLAETVLAALLEAVSAEFRTGHGTLPGQRVALVAFGRLGSREMTAGSDLDLIVIYDHDEEARESDGEKPLAPSQYFIRLTQRLIAALSAPTAEGIAYAVDLRLRPSGRSGPLATRIDAFTRYQAEQAWTWEHMALTRARPIAGDADLQAQVAAVVRSTVEAGYDRRKLATDIAAMRAKVNEARGAGDKWALKTQPGGLMDLEFLAQFLILAGLPPKPGEGLQGVLRRALDEGALTADDGAPLVESAVLQSALFQTMRIADEGPFEPATAPEAMTTLMADIATRALADAGAPPLQAEPEGDETLMISSVWGKAAAPISFDVLDGRLDAVQEQTRGVFRRMLGCSGA